MDIREAAKAYFAATERFRRAKALHDEQDDYCPGLREEAMADYHVAQAEMMRTYHTLENAKIRHAGGFTGEPSRHLPGCQLKTS